MMDIEYKLNANNEYIIAKINTDEKVYIYLINMKV